VGKSVLAAALLARLAAEGVRVRARKPVITGLGSPPTGDWPRDDELLARAADCDIEQVTLARFDPAVSPHLAAATAGVTLDCEALARQTLASAGYDEVLIVEGVGGLLVPLADGWDVARFARALSLPLLIAARPGLGTINHTLLTLEAARRRGLKVAGVVLTPWPAAPTPLERSNRETIAARGAVEVDVLGHVHLPEPALLSTAAAGLPINRWLDLGRWPTGPTGPNPRRA